MKKEPTGTGVWQVHKAKPSDKDAKAKYKECDKIVKLKAFEKAIAVEAKTVDIAAEIEASLESQSKSSPTLL